jgi:hypothetical protein
VVRPIAVSYLDIVMAVIVGPIIVIALGSRVGSF